MQRRHHHPAPNLPRLTVGGYQAGAHDKVQDLGEQAFAEGVCLREEHLFRDVVVRHHDEFLGSDGQDEHLAVRQEEFVERDEDGLAGDLADVSRRDGHAAHGLVPPPARELGEGHGESSGLGVVDVPDEPADAVEQVLGRGGARLGELAGRDALLQGLGAARGRDAATRESHAGRPVAPVQRFGPETAHRATRAEVGAGGRGRRDAGAPDGGRRGGERRVHHMEGGSL
mmetsp:Transcript_4535/g.20650  ORF Transcript_4535/g.20650 Transcript_4535/m.20650 type:complete len:228 (-) Transcript_4535:40-723(-)